MHARAKKIRAKAVAVVLSSGLFSNAFAGSTIVIDASKIVEKISVRGDFRGRYEHFDHDTDKTGTRDRGRYRIRTRIGIDFDLPHNLAIKTRLAGGGEDQVSTNETLDGNAGTKDLRLDRAYLQWKPWSEAAVNAGKMGNPFWRAKSSDLMWDGDYNPEGASEAVGFGLNDSVNLFIVLGQFVIEERSTDSDAYLFTEQVGAKASFGDSAGVELGLAHHAFTNISDGPTLMGTDIGGVGSFAAGSNSVNARFDLLELTTSVALALGPIPALIAGSYIVNRAAPDVDVDGDGAFEKEDRAFHVGAVLGKAKKRGSWEVAYFRKEVAKDAVVSGITDADLPHTTNAEAHIVWFAYAVTDFLKAQVKHFDARRLEHAAGAEGKIGRTQVDLSLAF